MHKDFIFLDKTSSKSSLSGIQRLYEVGLISFGALAIFIFIALTSFDPKDPSWSQSQYDVPINNLAGASGAWLADLLFFFLGFIAFLVPPACAYAGWALFQRRLRFYEIDFLALGLKIIGLFFLLIAFTALSSMNVDDIFSYSSGGLIGDVVSSSLMPYFNFVGTTLLLLCFFCTGVTLFLGVSWLFMIDKTGAMVTCGALWCWQQFIQFKDKSETPSDTKHSDTTENKNNADDLIDNQLDAANRFLSATAPNLTQSSTDDNDTLSRDDSHLHDTDKLEQFEREPENNLGAHSATDSEYAQEQSHHNTLSKLGRLFKSKPKSKLATTSPTIEPDVENLTLGNSSQDDLALSGEQLEPQIGNIYNLSSVDSTSEPLADAYLDASSENSDISEPTIPDINKPEFVETKLTVVADQPQPQNIQDLINSAAKEAIPPFPSFDLLDRPDKKTNPITQAEMDAVARLVESKLLDFGVQATVVGMYPGPVITRLELDLAPGVKVSKITNLSKDIARSLSAVSVRVVEVIPGKSYVGLELPNKHREIVRMSEVITSDEFAKNKSPLTMVLGGDISGKPVVVDLAKMPHLLVAGTTGSGKSVGVNVMITSLLYKSSPEDVRMIMIDPKMLELSVYEGIPHLLCEVVIDMKEASNALRWCVGEMERRYKLMSALGVRNMKGYNIKVLEAKERGEPILDPLWKSGDSMDMTPPELEKLPSIVVIIDEFADMMMIVGKKVEELIARIAQKARAAGIHLILATQRPSVDVITGLIKANVPTRMAFQVSSKIDSRTILDQQGADTLLGMGDMLYLPAGTSVPTRVHGAFIDDHEVHAVVADWKTRGKPEYIEDILNGDNSDEILLPGEQAENGDEESDAIYDEAVAFVTQSRKVSVSSVQRKFRIGYNRAARIVEQMEMSGVVTAAGHNGSREVLAPPPPPA